MADARLHSTIDKRLQGWEYYMLKRAAQTADIESEYDFIFVALALSLSYSNIEPFVESMSILPMFITARNRGIHMGMTRREFYTEVFRWALCAERTNRVLDYYALKEGMKRVQLTVPDDSPYCTHPVRERRNGARTDHRTRTFHLHLIVNIS